MPTIVIDDQPFSQDLARRTLAMIGINRTHVFGNAVEALAELPILRPRLVLVDYEMVPMSGVEFVARVRSAEEDWSKVPILMVTGHASPDYVRNAQKAGVNGYVVKPYSANMLRDRVRMALSKHESEGAIALKS